MPGGRDGSEAVLPSDEGSGLLAGRDEPGRKAFAAVLIPRIPFARDPCEFARDSGQVRPQPRDRSPAALVDLSRKASSWKGMNGR